MATREERIAELRAKHAEAEAKWQSSIMLYENDYWRRIMLVCEAELRGLEFEEPTCKSE